MARAVRGGTRVDAALLVLCALGALLGIVMPNGTRDAMAGAIRGSLAAPLVALQARSERARSAFIEREGIAARVDSLTLEVNALEQAARENDRLRALLSLGKRLGHGFVTADALHAQGASESHTVLLTVGSRAGVVARSPVVAPGGVVGLVTSVSPTTSHAILWSHPDFRVSAMSADGGTFGIVTPHLSSTDACVGADQAACSGPERMLLEMRGVAYRDALKVGTQIQSTGLGGVFPRGVLIGTVVAEIKTPEQWSRSYLLRPAVRPQDVSNVMVLSPGMVGEDLAGKFEPPRDPVLASQRVIAAADSLAQRAVSDSVARERAADSVVARRRFVLDSLAADSVAKAAPPPVVANPAIVVPAAPSADTSRRRPAARPPRPRPDSVRQ